MPPGLIWDIWNFRKPERPIKAEPLIRTMAEPGDSANFRIQISK
jgi:hypothetical protein